MLRVSALALLLLAVGLLSQPVSAQAGAQVANGAKGVNANHIAEGAVGLAQIPVNAVGSAQIASNSVGFAQLADGAVGSAQIADDSLNLFSNIYAGEPVGQATPVYVTSNYAGFAPRETTLGGCSVLNFPHLPVSAFSCNSNNVSLPFNGTGAINADRVLEDNAIGSDELPIGAIGSQDYFDNRYLAVIGRSRSTGASHYADNSVVSSLIPDYDLEGRHFSFSIDANQNEISTAFLQGNGLEGASFADNSVTRAKLVDDLVINSRKLADNGIAASAIANEAVTGAKLANGAVSGAGFADGAITRAKLAANFVLNFAKFADNAVTSAHLVDNSVVRAKLADGAVS